MQYITTISNYQRKYFDKEGDSNAHFFATIVRQDYGTWNVFYHPHGSRVRTIQHIVDGHEDKEPSYVHVGGMHLENLIEATFDVLYYETFIFDYNWMEGFPYLEMQQSVKHIHKSERDYRRTSGILPKIAVLHKDYNYAPF